MTKTVLHLASILILMSFFSFQCEVVRDSESTSKKADSAVSADSADKHDDNKKKSTSDKNLKENREDESDQIRISFYNVENLFDTINEPVKLDDEFTPESEKKWGTERYNDKLSKLSRVFASMGDGTDAPAIVGLAEVENKTVLNDLLKTEAFSANRYGIVHQESPDMRGIDLALLYRKDLVKLKSESFIEATFPAESEYTSRDILYAETQIDGERLHIIINHWPSRYGGAEKSEPRRLRVAELVRNKVDEIQKKSADAKIILLGDFNDGPTNKSITTVLKADTVRKESPKNHLVNISFPIEKNGGGSYNYRGQWQLMDQIIVSKALLSDKNMNTSEELTKVLREDYMLYKDKRYGPKPNRSFGGPNYYGGYSDHLPIYTDIKLNP